MTLKYEHLIGIPFEHGKNDCFELARRFYRDNFAIELVNYARPDKWWDAGLNLYGDHFFDQGFRSLDIPVNEMRPGDGFLMAVRSSVANHCAIYLGDGKLLHHFYNRLSEVVSYKGLWRNATVATLRHKDVVVEVEKEKTVDLMTILPENRRRRLQEAIDGSPISV